MKNLIKRLSQYEEQESRSIVRLLLFDVFGFTLTDICSGALDNLSPEQNQLLESLMKRLENGEPIQYVTGKSEFAGRTFSVRPGVLIPRPETEELCGMITSSLEKAGDIHILDIGTGSGCIAITLALDIPSSRVTAWDISPEALNIARENAQTLNAPVDFRLQDALHAPADQQCWDIIVSNPPYICTNEKAAMEPHVLDHEPHTALFVPDEKPLLFYEAICRYALSALKPQGMLAFEINPLNVDMTAEMLRQAGFSSVNIHCDQFGKQRFIIAQLKIEN